MLGIFRRWISPCASNGRAPEEFESFGRARVPRALGDRIVTGSPWRIELRDKAHDLLKHFERDEKETLIDRLLARFAIYVGDLGASEKNHHAEPYGLYEHSLEVAIESIKELRSARFRVSEDPSHEHHDRPLWIYGAFVLGMLHDVGKAFDLDVLEPGEKELWNPLAEPLLGFLSRHGLSRTRPELQKYHQKRGLKRHTWLGILLVQNILPSHAIHLLGPRLPRLLDGYVRSENFDAAQCLQGPEKDVVHIVRHFDRTLSRLAGQGSAGPDAAEVSPGNQGVKESKVSAGEGTVVPSVPQPVPSESPAASVLKLQDTPLTGKPDQSGQAPAELPVSSRGAEHPPVPAAASNRRIEPTPAGLLFSVPPVADRKQAVELEPVRLLRNLHDAIMSAGLSRNSPRAPVFLGKSRTWLVYPEAFAGLAKYLRIPYTQGLHEYLLKVLASLPHTDPKELVYARVSPEAKDAVPLIGVFTAGFMTDAELETLGIWKYEIVPSQGRSAPRALQLLGEGSAQGEEREAA